MLFVGLGVSLKLLPKIGIKASLTASFLISAVGLLMLTGISIHSSYAGGVLPACS